MVLDQALAEKVIKKLENVQPYHVVVIDHEGIIVGATDERILGKRHWDAIHRMEEYRRLLSSPSGGKSRNTVKEGGNGRCLFVKNELVGAIGLTGLTEQVIPYLEMTRTIAELVLEWEAEQRQESIRKATDHQVLRRLISPHKDRAKLSEALALHGIDLSRPRTVVLIKFSPIQREGVVKQEGRNQESIFQDAMRNMLSSLRSRFSFEYDLLLPEPEHRLVMILCADRSRDPIGNESKLVQLCEAVEEDSRVNYGIALKAVVGRRCCCLEDYDGQYQQMMLKFELGEFLFPRTPVLLGNSIVLGNIAAFVPEREKRSIAEHVLGSLLRSNQKDLYLETLEVLFACDMNSTEASQKLFIHRNTLQHRLKKIEELTGYSVYHIDDILTLRLGYLFYRSFNS